MGHRAELGRCGRDGVVWGRWRCLRGGQADVGALQGVRLVGGVGRGPSEQGGADGGDGGLFFAADEVAVDVFGDRDGGVAEYFGYDV